MSDVAEKVREVVARSFDVDSKTLSDVTTPLDVEGWDSLAHGLLVLRLQKVFGVRLDPAAASTAQSLGALTALVTRAL